MFWNRLRPDDLAHRMCRLALFSIVRYFLCRVGGRELCTQYAVRVPRQGGHEQVEGNNDFCGTECGWTYDEPDDYVDCGGLFPNLLCVGKNTFYYDGYNI